MSVTLQHQYKDYYLVTVTDDDNQQKHIYLKKEDLKELQSLKVPQVVSNDDIYQIDLRLQTAESTGHKWGYLDYYFKFNDKVYRLCKEYNGTSKVSYKLYEKKEYSDQFIFSTENIENKILNEEFSQNYEFLNTFILASQQYDIKFKL